MQRFAVTHEKCSLFIVTAVLISNSAAASECLALYRDHSNGAFRHALSCVAIGTPSCVNAMAEWNDALAQKKILVSDCKLGNRVEVNAGQEQSSQRTPLDYAVDLTLSLNTMRDTHSISKNQTGLAINYLNQESSSSLNEFHNLISKFDAESNYGIRSAESGFTSYQSNYSRIRQQRSSQSNFVRSTYENRNMAEELARHAAISNESGVIFENTRQGDSGRTQRGRVALETFSDILSVFAAVATSRNYQQYRSYQQYNSYQQMERPMGLQPSGRMEEAFSNSANAIISYNPAITGRSQDGLGWCGVPKAGDTRGTLACE